jgi:hypothetical protein
MQAEQNLHSPKFRRYSRNRIALPCVAAALGLFHQEKGHFPESIEATYFLFLL